MFCQTPLNLKAMAFECLIRARDYPHEASPPGGVAARDRI